MLSRPNGVLLGNGAVYRLQFTTAPQIITPPASLIRLPGEPATFQVEASSSVEVAYQWQRDGADIPGATEASYTLPDPQLPDNGAQFRVVVRNVAGTVVSEPAVLTVTTNQRPVPTIDLPAEGTTFTAGDTITFSGRATDAEDGDLPAAAFSWRIDYFTGPTVQRPFVPETPGITSGSAVIPTRTPFTRPDVFYRIVLTVRDSFGHVVSTTRDIQPRTARVDVQTDPPGATLSLDGTPASSPFSFVGVVGVERELAAAPTTNIGGFLIPFAGWSDGVPDRVRTIATPSTDTTFQARYSGDPVGVVDSLVVVGRSRDGVAAVRTLDAATGAEVSRIDLTATGLRAEARVAHADVTGDGVADVIVGAGPGDGPIVAIFDGMTAALITTFVVFEPTYVGGLFVAAADMDGDGRAEVVVSPDNGGGPRVRVFRNGDPAAVLADFFGIDDSAFRGGARVALGDVTGDGRADLLVAAGLGGGPRVAGFDAASLAAGSPQRIFADFFAFEPEVRNGAYLAVGDVNADGRGDVIAGGGPGGGPRVLVLSGAELVQASELRTLANFFAGDVSARNGVRLTVTDVDGDSFRDLVVGSAAGPTATATVYRGLDLLPDSTPVAFRTITAFEDDFTGGVFVG